MITVRLARRLPMFIVILLLCIGGFTGVASAQKIVDVKTVADLEKTLGSPDQPTVFTVSTDILIHAGTYLLTSPLPLDANPGVTVTLRNFGDGPVILQATGGDNILQTGWNSSDNGGLGPYPAFVVKGLTFSGARTAINGAVGAVLVADCTFVDNGLGYYTDFSRAVVSFENDTFTRNSIGIELDTVQSSSAKNLTVVGNQNFGVTGLQVLSNSIVFGNTFGDCSAFSSLPLSVLASIDSDGTCGAGATTIDPQLGALDDNGGLVQTMALPPGSPAVNAGSNAVCPQTDARGALRGDGLCDIGAFERSQGFTADSVTNKGAVEFSTLDGTFVDFHAVDPSSPSQAGRPAGVDFPFGLFEWTLVGLHDVGATVEVSITFPSPVPQPPQYWKVDSSGVWTDVCAPPLLACNVDSGSPNVLHLTITDGGVGDLDGTANGTILDPGGLGVSTTIANQPPEANAGGPYTGFAGDACMATVRLNGTGSRDPDGDPLTFTWAGPFPTASGPTPTITLQGVGPKSITLKVSDGRGGTAVAPAVATVVDATPPTVACSAPRTVKTSELPPGACSFTAPVSATATDNCGSPSITCTDSSLSAPGSTTSTCTAIDQFRNAASCSTSLTLIDDTPPAVSCTVGSGWAYTIKAVDNCVGTVGISRGDTRGPVSQGTQVDPTLTNVTLTATDSSRNTSSAVCPAPPLTTGNGRTPGFWGSKQATITAGDLLFLSSLNLKGSTGDNFDPVTVKSFQDWLNAATATNMAYMLSAQLAAMELNVKLLKQNPDQFLFTSAVYSACGVGFPKGLTIATLMTAANDELAVHNRTFSGSPSRACQEAMKNVLDDANSNKSIFVQ